MSGYQQLSEGGRGEKQLLVRRFRVDRYDSAGNRLESVQAELRGYSFEGDIHDGDNVKVEGEWSQGQAFKATKVFNKSTNVLVRAKNYEEMWDDQLDAVGTSERGKRATKLLSRGCLIMFGIVAMAVGGFILVGFLSAASPSNNFECRKASTDVEYANKAVDSLETTLQSALDRDQRQFVENELRAKQAELVSAQQRLAACQ